MRARTMVGWGAILALAIARCGGDGAGPSAQPADIQASSGDNQEANVGELLAAALRVLVTDANGDAVRNASVDWAVTAGGGLLSAARSQTGADGVAQTTLTLGAAPGRSTVTATVGSLPPAAFTALGFAMIVDPSSDGFGTGQPPGSVPPQLIRLSAAPDGGNLIVRFEFQFAVVQQTTGGPNVVTGYLDIDTDQNVATGIQPATDVFRPGAGSTGMGSEFFVAMFGGPYDIVRTSDGLTTGTIVPVFVGNRITLAIPLTLLGGDDGRINLAVVVGTDVEPTDIAPNDGNLRVAPPTPVAAAGTGPAPVPTTPPAVRAWGRWRARIGR